MIVHLLAAWLNDRGLEGVARPHSLSERHTIDNQAGDLLAIACLCISCTPLTALQEVSLNLSCIFRLVSQRLYSFYEEVHSFV